MSIRQPPTRIDGPVAVIGDVHGQLSELRQIIHQLEHTPEIHRRWIVFIGDLVDRGPDSRGVLDLYCDLSKHHDRVTWICGNHELAMAASLGLIQTPDYVDWKNNWLQLYSAEPTFESYSVQFRDVAALRSALPEEHTALLSNLPWIVEHPQYLFVHAGLDPDLPFDMQIQILRKRDYSLAQPPWLFSRTFIQGPVPRECPVTVVQGHVPLQEVHFGNRIIGTDTTGGVSGDLSCVLLPENIVLTSADNAPLDEIP
ncbi:MAG: metallophosphoesterase [Fuerstiella sp.]|nr:metallophosphoesterase [Fuerstiella sp.]